MANEKTIHGRIDCPCCGTEKGVRITQDKNGKPFGFCDAKCGIQLRIGGDTYREAEFNKKYPAIAASVRGDSVTDTEKKPTLQQTEKPKTGFDLGL